MAFLAFLGLSFAFAGQNFSEPELARRELPAYRSKNCTSETRTGYLKNTAGQYLTCTNENCEWAAFSETATQLFHQEDTKPPKERNHQHRDRSESRFYIYTPSGAPTGQCLDQFTNMDEPPKLRMASCDLRGAEHWLLCGGFLSTNRRDCVQSNAQVAPCHESHEVITMEAPKCKITSTTIDHLECLSPIAGGACAATGFDKNTMAGASSQSDCDACHAAEGSTQQCSFSFAYTTQNTISQSWSHSHTWDIGVSFELEEDFVFGEAKEGMSWSFSGTLTKGHSKSTTTAMQDTTGCSVTLQAGTRESARANYLVGTIHADFNATVTRHYSCNTGATTKKSYVDTLTLTITNVPTQKIVGTCTTDSTKCGSALPGNIPPPPPLNPGSDQVA